MVCVDTFNFLLICHAGAPPGRRRRCAWLFRRMFAMQIHNRFA